MCLTRRLADSSFARLRNHRLHVSSSFDTSWFTFLSSPHSITFVAPYTLMRVFARISGVLPKSQAFPKPHNTSSFDLFSRFLLPFQPLRLGEPDFSGLLCPFGISNCSCDTSSVWTRCFLLLGQLSALCLSRQSSKPVSLKLRKKDQRKFRSTMVDTYLG